MNQQDTPRTRWRDRVREDAQKRVRKGRHSSQQDTYERIELSGGFFTVIHPNGNIYG
jgi:hypothetical protein